MSDAAAAAADKSAFGVFTRPNFFELYLRDRVPSLLDDALVALWRRWAAGSLPRISGRAACAVLRAALESVCLWKADATLGDALVGLQRVRAADGAPLAAWQKLCVVLLGAGVPLAARLLGRCARRQFEGVYEHQLANQSALSRTKQAWLRVCDRVGRVARAVLPWLRAGHALVAVLFAVAFLADLTRFPSLGELVLGTTVRRQVVTLPSQPAGGLWGALRSTGSSAVGVFRMLLPLLAFGYRSLEWWYAVPHSLLARAKSSAEHQWPQDTPQPPPPEAPALAPGVTLPADSSRCPLCGKPRRAPAVLCVSGFAFCFACIVRYLRQYHRCPLTGISAQEADVRRLFLK